jgi:hypothetical protein
LGRPGYGSTAESREHPDSDAAMAISSRQWFRRALSGGSR